MRRFLEDIERIVERSAKMPDDIRVTTNKQIYISSSDYLDSDLIKEIELYCKSKPLDMEVGKDHNNLNHFIKITRNYE